MTPSILFRSTAVPALAIVLAAGAGGCKVKDGRVPLAVPAGISIPVTVDGAPAPALDTAWLSRTKPHFRDSNDRRAWKLSVLVGPVVDAPGTLVEVESDGGPAAELRVAEGSVPVATMNKSGELVVKLADPVNPFPNYHGRGGNRGRSGDHERVRAVTAIRVTTGGATSAAGGDRTLRVEVAGKEPATWSAAELGKLERVTFTSRDGEKTSGYSLRALARAAAGVGARVSAVDAGSGSVAIDEKAWDDGSKTPVLRVNARGELKLDWAGADGSRADGPEAHGVHAVRVVPGA